MNELCICPILAVAASAKNACRAASQTELESLHLQPDELLEYDLETDTFGKVKGPPERSLTYLNSLEF
jgi:hypothetical protein